MSEKPVKKQIEVTDISLSNPASLLGLATTLKQFIIEQKLYSLIQGRNYVNVEGWQFAGGMLGVLPIVQNTENLSTDTEIKYRATVQLVNVANDKVIGGGIATCSNKEAGKKHFAEYAIESMAQTRATGKAYRLMLGWLMKAAGYEATPAEEMDFQTAEVVETKAKPPVAEPVPTTISEPQPEQPAVKYASSAQKEELIKLLNHDIITRQEKTKMLLNIHKLDEERANQAIEKLKATIAEREQQESEAKHFDLSEDLQRERNAIYANLIAFKDLLGEQDFQAAYEEASAITESTAKQLKEKVQSAILKRLKAGREGMNHQATEKQLDFIDKLLLSRVFSIEVKQTFNTSSFEYEHPEATNKIKDLQRQIEAAKAKPAAA